jgi:transposase
MSRRNKTIVDIIAMLQHMRAGKSNRQIRDELGVDRRTAQKYRDWAEGQGLLSGELPGVSQLQKLQAETFGQPRPPQNVSTVEPYRTLVVKLRQENVEIAAIRERLKERGYTGSYDAVRRFVRRLEPSPLDVTVRVECQPGEEAQVDFGYAGLMPDPDTGQSRRAWAFVMTLSWSRHQYVEFVWDQTVASWLHLHRNAFAFLGGVPQRVVIDNLKAGITKACWDDPQVQMTYRECAEHYGFLIAPCRPRTPQHKGKVEQGGVHYVKRNFLNGREPTSLLQANRDVHAWCLTTAGERCHGTTREQPLVRFQETEQSALQPLPNAPYDLAVWKQVKLHRDCHVVFDNAYYSAPFRLVGQQLYARGGTREVRLYDGDYQLVATHGRAQSAGQRQTHPAHLPPELLPGLFLDRDGCLAVATDIGPATAQLMTALLADRVVERLPIARRLLALRDRYGDDRLEAACARAWRYDDVSYKTVKEILQQGLDQVAEPTPAPVASAKEFARTAAELLGSLFEGRLSWN